MVETLAQAIGALRTISRDLHPAALDRLGLPAALQALAERLAHREGWTLHLDLLSADPGGSERLPQSLQVGLFRVAQEALFNIARHAQAQRVWVGLYPSQRDIRLTIRDDGRGCTPEAVRSPGIGWATLHERATLLGGTCRITAHPGKGVEVELWAPLK